MYLHAVAGLGGGRPTHYHPWLGQCRRRCRRKPTIFLILPWKMQFLYGVLFEVRFGATQIAGAASFVFAVWGQNVG